MVIAVDEPTFVDTILFYGLFVGAIFQVVCIMSAVFVPKSTEEQLLRAEPVRAKTRRALDSVDDFIRNVTEGLDSLTREEYGSQKVERMHKTEMDEADHPAEPAPPNTVKQSHDSARRGKKQSKKHR